MSPWRGIGGGREGKSLAGFRRKRIKFYVSVEVLDLREGDETERVAICDFIEF
jgi:hypothetical protein